jgi:hypothetical protein
MADVWNLTGDNAVDQGARLQLRVTVVDGVNAPIFGIGSTPKMQIRAGKDATSSLICNVGTTPNTTIAYNYLTGDVDVDIKTSVTTGWSFESAYYDVAIVDAVSGETYRVAEGQMALNKNVTA